MFLLSRVQVIANDHLGRKGRRALLHTTALRSILIDAYQRGVKCSPDDTVGDLKKLIAAQTGTDWRKIELRKWYVVNSACGRCLSHVVLKIACPGTPSSHNNCVMMQADIQQVRLLLLNVRPSSETGDNAVHTIT